LSVRGDGVPEMDVPLLAGTDVGQLGLAGRAMSVLSRKLTGA
jgi:D-alanyl-D-alanine carboxypeptidase (penicillin-binding protein 5/6)